MVSCTTIVTERHGFLIFGIFLGFFCEFLKWNILNVSVILSVEPGKSLVAIDVQQTALLIFLHTPA